MSQETTQDLTQLQSNLEIGNSPQGLQGGSEYNSECIATLGFEDVVSREKQDFAIYPGEEIQVGREIQYEPPTTRKTFKMFAIHDPRISKRHFRIYSIIYEQKNNCETQSEMLPPLVYCEDMESSNGTYVNGDLIGIMGKEKVAYLLCDGDVIEIRPNWKFTFQQSNDQMIFPSMAQSKDTQHFADLYSVSDRILGSGHFGSVYLAKELSTKKQVACKVVDIESVMRSVSENCPHNSGTGMLWKSRVDSARKRKKKVLLEIEILSKLSHPNIINIRKAFSSDNALYIFTDLAPAGDLYSYAQSYGGHLGDYDARVVTKQITLALEYIHSQGIAHRDIKQENVLVTSTDFGGRVLLTDFGFATYFTGTNGKMGRMLSRVGTEGFVAPEVENVQNLSLGYTKAADLWSLGIMTASLLTGGMTIPEGLSQLSQIENADRFLSVDDSYARMRWAQVPPRALRFIRKLLAADPEERMTAAQALKHSWYTKPAREAQALDEGLQRINRFWKRRSTPSDGVLEAFAGLVSSSPAAVAPKFGRKLPDATSSPYFGLDRHLNQKHPSTRKRLLNDLNESGSPFLISPGLQQSNSVANIGARRMNGLRRVVSVGSADLFGMSPNKNDSLKRVADVKINTIVSEDNSDEDELADCIRGQL